MAHLISTDSGGHYDLDTARGAYEYLSEWIALKGASSDVFATLTSLYREATKASESTKELVEALRIVLVQFGEYSDGDGAAKYHAINNARQAIAKATGGA